MTVIMFQKSLKNETNKINAVVFHTSKVFVFSKWQNYIYE